MPDGLRRNLTTAGRDKSEFTGRPNLVYFNENGRLSPTAGWQAPAIENDETTSVAWGDIDADGDLDLAIGNLGSNKVYCNENGSLLPSPCWVSNDEDFTYDLKWGDINGDGFFDLVAANFDGENKLYTHLGAKEAPFFPPAGDPLPNKPPGETRTLAIVDADNNGLLDVAIGATFGTLSGTFNQVGTTIYLNQGQANGRTQFEIKRPDWLRRFNDFAWGDINNDNLIDLAMVGPSDGAVKFLAHQDEREIQIGMIALRYRTFSVCRTGK